MNKDDRIRRIVFDYKLNAKRIFNRKSLIMTIKLENMEVTDIAKEIFHEQCTDEKEKMYLEDKLSETSLSPYQDDVNLDEPTLITDLVRKDNDDTSQLVISSQQNRMRIALGVLFRLVLPLFNGVARGWRGIGGVRLLQALRNLSASRQILTNMLAYAVNTISLSLSSVQVVHRIDPILKIVKLKKGSITKSISSSTQEEYIANVPLTLSSKTSVAEIEEDENRITLNVLAEPPPGTPIRADVIFIHGLHGSLVNTWKQGLWNKNGKPVHFERPPRPPMRPPKRPRHSRSAIFSPPHSIKRRRYSEDENHFSYDSEVTMENQQNFNFLNDYTYECGSPTIINYCDGVEYSFPEFKLQNEDYQNSTPPSENSEEDEDSLEKEGQRTTEEKLSKRTTEPYSYCWPGDWLPLDCPGVRVIALDYTTDPYLWRPVWVRKRKRTTLTERARKMTDLLIEKRVGYGHPIVWVGHSKGGLFIKQILIDAWESGRAAAAPLWKFSRGVFFYSVPHRGSILADFNLPFLRQSIELQEIQKNCPSILELHRRFVALYQSGNLKIEVFSFVETALTLMSVLYLRIVGVDSADPGIGEVCGVHLDHREVCKPRSRKCILYIELVKMLNKIS